MYENRDVPPKSINKVIFKAVASLFPVSPISLSSSLPLSLSVPLSLPLPLIYTHFSTWKKSQFSVCTGRQRHRLWENGSLTKLCSNKKEKVGLISLCTLVTLSGQKLPFNADLKTL